MREIKEKITDWCQKTESTAIASWDSFPGIPLYMDQVISVLKDQLEPFKRHDDDNLLTSSMINNYVKHGVIPHPLHKKYTKEQIAGISVVAMLKSVLQIQDLKTLLSDCPNTQDFYQSFIITQLKAQEEVNSQLSTALEDGSNLKLLALRLSAEAMARQKAAEKILTQLSTEAEPKQVRKELRKK